MREARNKDTERYLQILEQRFNQNTYEAHSLVFPLKFVHQMFTYFHCRQKLRNKWTLSKNVQIYDLFQIIQYS